VALVSTTANSPIRVSSCGLAANANTPPELLGHPAADEQSYVRSRVAENAKTTQEVLSRLAADERRDVRWDVARNAGLLLEDIL